MIETYGLHAGFLKSLARFPGRPALEVEGSVLTYQQLHDQAVTFAAPLAAQLPAGTRQRVGILTNRGLTAFAGILGTLMAGCALVPLNPGFPTERTRQMLDLADVGALLVDGKGLAQIDEVLVGTKHPLLVLVPGTTVDEALSARWPQHRFVAAAGLPVPDTFKPASVTPDTLACLFFTSGSTGVPKGVGVLHSNVLAFVAMSMHRYRACGIDETDRFSQFYDITFDSSMFDLYVCWAFGASLCVPTAADWINPNKYIDSKALTVIDIVPSTGHAMNRSNGWRPGRFGTLRLCRFGGEALSADLAAALAAAAPRAVIENVYGPTECTVDAAYYRWDPAVAATQCEHGVVPIGHAGLNVGLRIVNEALQEVEPGGEGELLISGPQVAPGYWKNPERTAGSFINLPGSEVIHYRTGDLVRRPRGSEPIGYLGRFDHQIKISGVRIELGEIEQALRQVAGTALAVAVGWPVTTSGASGIVAFVVMPNADAAALREQLKSTLPAVMVPREIIALAELPLNVNGKVDRKALIESLTRPISAKA